MGLAVSQIARRMHLTGMDHTEAASRHSVVRAPVVILTRPVQAQAQLILVVHVFRQRFRWARSVAVAFNENTLV